MRERHHLRFRDATAKLREQHKEVVKRNRLLEKQLLKSSVREGREEIGKERFLVTKGSFLYFIRGKETRIILCFIYLFLSLQDAMSELNSELHHKQGMVGELKSSVTTVR